MKHDSRIYAERLRMVLDGIAESLPVGFILSTVLLVVFAFSSNQSMSAISADDATPVLVRSARIDLVALGTWYGAFLIGRIALVGFARRQRAHGYDAAAIPGIVRRLVLAKGYEGVVWGSLCWIVCHENTSPGATALLLALMGAISSNAVALLSPIMRLYVVLVVPMLLLSACRFMAMDGIIYHGIAICCLLYVLGQYGQARLIGRGLITSIRLRYENLDLIARLETEKEAVGLAREMAETANVAKSRFLAAASHDLRQPVHALGLFLEALSCSELDRLQQQIVENAKASSVASSEMLNTLLDFSRIEAGVVKPRPRPIALQDMLHKLETELAPQADAKQLIYRSRETTLAGVCDPSLMELILRNLIANAIRYTETGGILVSCRRLGNEIAIDVHDTGVGIAPDQQREIFREFHQLGNPERDHRKGLGLGLAIADGLARSMGHSLSLISTPGRGSRFRICVPMALRPVQPVTLESAPVHPHVDLGGKRVLVIDDDEAVRVGMRQILGHWGIEAVAVESLADALAHAGHVAPDAILCDYRLRAGDTGGAAIARLRHHYRCNVPALLITGDTAPERLRDALASGIPLLHKPVPPEQLRSALQGLFGSAPLSQQRPDANDTSSAAIRGNAVN